MRNLAWRIFFLVLLMVPLPGCGAEGSGEAPAASAKMAEATAAPSSAVGGAAPAASAAADESPKGADGKEKKAATTWKRSTLSSNASRLMVGDNASLPLVATQVSVWIDGFRARVVVDSYFANDKGQTYEGTFQLRLPSDASPYYFAFGETVGVAEPPPVFAAAAAGKLGSTPERIRKDRESSWSAPKEARMVPKEQAAQAYGDTVRQRIDPALVEWAGAGVFNARVFPLTAGKIHRVVLGYDVDLISIAGELEHIVDVPKDSKKVIVDVMVLQPSGIETTIVPPSASSVDGDHPFSI